MDEVDENRFAFQKELKELGLKSAKSVKTHLILERIYKSNLVTDISSVDSLGMTRLKEIEGLPTFIDDLFIYGYLAKHEVVQQKKRSLSEREMMKQVVELSVEYRMIRKPNSMEGSVLKRS